MHRVLSDRIVIMARMKQTNMKSTGGRAPRKLLESQRRAMAAAADQAATAEAATASVAITSGVELSKKEAETEAAQTEKIVSSPAKAPAEGDAAKPAAEGNDIVSVTRSGKRRVARKGTSSSVPSKKQKK
eukprot:gb/GEZN01020767.1/.p2 GENE.gb/GEZN01020767.1/~~gb/GEZN01020767.1/.p2  ORF type:complete len:130 (+),score=23.26 gb/GEZN01020767.1/:53-442(+)